MTDLVLDSLLFESMEAGTSAFVAEWLAAEGDHVHAGQTLARVHLVHRLVDLPTPHAGILEEIRIPIGAPFDRGTVLARLVPT